MISAAASLPALLRSNGLGFFAGATLVSLIGDGLFRVAISLQVYAIVQDPRALASVGFAWGVGQFLLLPVAGWASDRWPKRRLLIVADLWRGLVIAAIAVLSLSGQLRIVHLAALGLLFGAGNALFNPTATALLPEIVDDPSLPHVNALLGGLRPLMLYVVGPVLGGVVVGTLGTGAAFVADAVSFVASAALVARVRPPAGAGRAQPSANPWPAVVDGLRVVARRRWLWLGMAALGLSGLAFQGPFEVLVPFLLVTRLGQTQGEAAASLASIMAASGIGSAAMAFLLARRQLPSRFLLALYLSEACSLFMLALIGASTRIWQMITAGLVVGATLALTETVWTTTVQRHVPREALGRVASLDWMLSVGLLPLSFAVAGWLGSALDARLTLVVVGLASGLGLVALSAAPGARSPEGPAASSAADGDSAPAPSS